VAVATRQNEDTAQEDVGKRRLSGLLLGL